MILLNYKDAIKISICLCLKKEKEIDFIKAKLKKKSILLNEKMYIFRCKINSKNIIHSIYLNKSFFILIYILMTHKPNTDNNKSIL